MAIWLFRAGKFGGYETKFLEESKIYLTWEGLDVNLSSFKTQTELYRFLLDFYSDAKKNTIRNWTGQIWPIAKRINKGDWVVLPSKLKSAIHIGEIKGEYKYVKKGEDPFFHYREVDWFATDIPRSNFDQDILYSLGAFMTVCKISRNNAEERIKEMSKNKWVVPKKEVEEIEEKDEADNESTFESDLEIVATDQIAKHIIDQFREHEMEVLIEAILKAKGYTTFKTQVGPDKGLDIIAAPGQLGFGSPKICVQVKSGITPVDRPTLDQLVGVMQNFGAEYGLLASWNGFKRTVEQERANQFFKVRLWDQQDIIKELLANYEKLNEDIKLRIPLKQIWTLSTSDED